MRPVFFTYLWFFVGVKLRFYLKITSLPAGFSSINCYFRLKIRLAIVSRDKIIGFWAFLLFALAAQAQPSLKGKPGISKEYAIRSAHYADRSYKFAKLSGYVEQAQLSRLSLDSAAFFISESIASMDSAIFFAGDSGLVALDLAHISRKYSGRAQKKISKAMQASGSSKAVLLEDATILSANAVADAYHASMYFKGELKKKEIPAEKKDDATTNKMVTKLDVDQSVFSLLVKDLESKITENKANLDKLKADLSKTKDPAKATKLKAQIKKLEKEIAELETKKTDSKTKLSSIDAQIAERDKTGKAPPEPKLAKGLKLESVDEWNKHLILDSDMPEGLFYQVQVGVYKNKVLYEIFKGLTPVYGKTTPQGISYSIGRFEKMADANQAKDYVKSIGLTDAFVVAYYNKKRVTPAEALKLEKK